MGLDAIDGWLAVMRGAVSEVSLRTRTARAFHLFEEMIDAYRVEVPVRKRWISLGR